MDEAGGTCGILTAIVVIALALVLWRSSDDSQAPAPVLPPDGVESGATPMPGEVPRTGPGGDPPEPGWWPPSRRATIWLVGLLYFGGLFLVRPRAIRAKRNGATDQQAALIALATFAFSPVVVPVVVSWRGLGLLGRALTSGPDEHGGGPSSKPSPPRGANDLD